MGTTGETPSVASRILALERAALDRWGQGDPDGFLEICAEDVTYFDPYVERRLDGVADLGAWYDGIRGTVRVDSDEIVDPRVQVMGDAAILTYRYISQTGEAGAYWNCTEVYRQSGEDWRIAHSHWSLTQPELAEE
jgi:ketosteroid isomerase-like protein